MGLDNLTRVGSRNKLELGRKAVKRRNQKSKGIQKGEDYKELAAPHLQTLIHRLLLKGGIAASGGGGSLEGRIGQDNTLDKIRL